jgi:hypothetical protein
MTRQIRLQGIKEKGQPLCCGCPFFMTFRGCRVRGSFTLGPAPLVVRQAHHDRSRHRSPSERRGSLNGRGLRREIRAGFILRCPRSRLQGSIFLFLLFLFPFDRNIAAGTISRVILGHLSGSATDRYPLVRASRLVSCRIFPFRHFHDLLISSMGFHR